jgi:nucleoside 2-deoxyribosyltransferase
MAALSHNTTRINKIYEPAIKKAGLNPMRADQDIFGTGKIIDQIWSGINAARVLVAELTTRNPNVFYELGLAHALEKPVVLVSSNQDDIPFDLKHIRVIYYDMTDPFWGSKLLDKVAENILSAIEHPEEAVLKRTLQN